MRYSSYLLFSAISLLLLAVSGAYDFIMRLLFLVGWEYKDKKKYKV